MANPIFVGEGEPHALLFRHLDLSLVQANLIPFMRNLDSFMENGLIETKIWMLGILVIPEASLLVDFFQLIEGEKMHVFIYANMSICTCMHTFIPVLLIIAKRWKQPPNPSTDKWINKTYLWHNNKKKVVYNYSRIR